MTIMKAIGVALLLSIATAAGAQDAGEGTQLPPFAELDSDQNGYITETEATRAPALVEVFGQLDINDDNQLDAQEFGQVAEIH